MYNNNGSHDQQITTSKLGFVSPVQKLQSIKHTIRHFQVFLVGL